MLQSHSSLQSDVLVDELVHLSCFQAQVKDALHDGQETYLKRFLNSSCLKGEYFATSDAAQSSFVNHVTSLL